MLGIVLNDINNITIRYGGVLNIQFGIVNCSSFSHNTVGGGVLDMNVMCTAEVFQSQFENNTANVGGVVVILRDGKLVMEDSVFTGSRNNIDIGGIIRAVERNNIAIRNCNFSHNVANYGGVIAVLLNNTIDIANSSFANNSATSDGAAIYIRTLSVVTITNSSFAHNTATNDGIVLAADSSSMTLKNIAFTNNTVRHDGGAAYAYQYTDLRIDNCTFLNNLANNSGGAVYVRNNCYSNVTVTNCTIIVNKQQHGSEFRWRCACTGLQLCLHCRYKL